jgi:SpoIID/LytB domain protein
MTRLHRRCVAALVALLSISMLGIVVAPPANAADAGKRSVSTANAYTGDMPPTAVLVRGRGNGHGRGLSQFGAYGWATAYGRSWQEILTFYYINGTNNSISTLQPTDPSSEIRARLVTFDDRNQVAMISRTGQLSVNGQGPYGAVLLREVSRNRYDIYAAAASNCTFETGVPSGFTLIAGSIEAPTVTVPSSGTSSGVAPNDLIGLCEPPTRAITRGRVRYYRGSIQAVNDANGANRVVNQVNIEEYLRGVVPRESPATWGSAAGGAGMNALRAQSVAARTYALSQNRYSYARTCDTSSCQVYGGAALHTIGDGPQVIEHPLTDAAIADTRGTVIRSGAGTLVSTEYTSSNGGRTASGNFKAQQDDGDIAADALLQSWSRIFTAEQMEKKYPSIGIFTGISTQHDGLGGDWNGYALSVTITGTAGAVTRSAWNFRNDWDLHAPWYETTAISYSSTAPVVGPMVYIGDSVSESIASQFSAVISPSYPSVNFQACAGRGMVGAACIAGARASSLNLDGVNVVNALPETPAAAIIKLGYNDDPATFNTELQQMISTLTIRGVARMIFINLSTRSTTRNYALANEALNAAAASNPAITVLDWNAFVSQQHRWRLFDNDSLCCGVHLNASGRVEFAMWLREQLDSLRSQGLLPVTAAGGTLVGLPLRSNHRGSMVTAAQRRLNTVLKLRPKKRIKVDGIYGKSTRQMVRRFQTRSGLPATGVIDRATWEALGLAQRPALASLRKGTKHPSVRIAHRSLNKVLKTNLRVTDTYSSSTVAAVRTFQQRTGLRVNGRLNGPTWTMLMATAARTK